MNRIMGFTFFLLLLAAIALISLQDMRPIAEGRAGSVFTGIDWRPVSIGDEPVDADTMLTLRFEVDGKIGGHGGCNLFFASYTTSQAGIDIGPIGATRMACPEPQMTLEQKLFDALDNTSAVELRDSRLHLVDSTGATLAVFVDIAANDSPRAK
jgi:putative lipoprotein